MNLNKTKVLTIIGTRPEIIRLSRIIDRLSKSPVVDHTLVHTGQNYDHSLNEVFFNDLKLPEPDIYLNAAGNSPSETIGQILIKIEKAIDEIIPDAILVLGDTNSCLSAIVAKKKKIPIFHYEAGNRCFDQRVPEEINRKIVDHISDINLTYSSIAKSYLINEGFPSDRIINIGSPMNEVLSHYMPGIKKSKILSKLKIETGKYFLISCHREENVDDSKTFKKLVSSLNHLAKEYKLPIIFPIHPRTRKNYIKSGLKLHSLVKLIDPIGFLDYNKLQMESKVVLSDSGTIFEESSILNFRALNIRESHERPEAIEEASVIITGLNLNKILQGILISEDQNIGGSRNINLVKEYSHSNISIKVERIILSYIDYVNRVVWQKES